RRWSPPPCPTFAATGRGTHHATGCRRFRRRASDVSITASDGMVLRAWVIQPHHANGNAALLLHGLADNRLGMTGYAQLLLRHGLVVLLPDARAHGESGGDLATYGLLERNDIHQWF